MTNSNLSQLEQARERDPRPLTLVLVSLGLIGLAVVLLFAAAHVQEGIGLVNNPTSFAGPDTAPRGEIITQQGKDDAAGFISALGAIVDADDPSTLRGQQVALFDVPVQAVPGDFLFWVGGEQGTVPVALMGEITARQGDARTRVAPGQKVRVFGIVRLVQDASVLFKDALLSAEEKDRLRTASVYVEASRVEVLQDPSRDVN